MTQQQPERRNRNQGPKRPFKRRQAQGPIVWDMEYLHKYNTAKATSVYWQGNGQYAWSSQWLQYAGDMLNLAKGTYFSKKPPQYPKCGDDTQMGSPYVKPGHLQNVG